jgi:transcriptional regulator with XRE-family HTH domain
VNLGTLLRYHRKEKGLTLRAVAEKAGVSEGFVSQVENNVKTPSLDTLLNICTAIDIQVGDVLNQLQNQQSLFVFRKKEWGEVDVPHTGFATRRFCAPEDRELIDSAILFIEPGKSIPVRKDVKNSQEVICVLQGSLELRHGEDVVTLSQGDAVHLWTEPRNQAVTNPGKNQAVVMWVGTL